MSRLRVLILVNRWYSDGGVENFIQQLVSETGDMVSYTVGSLITGVEAAIDCEKIGPLIPSGKIEHMFTSGEKIKAAMRNGHFDVAHIQASNGSAFYLCNLAEAAGIPRRIIHSHNAGAESASSPVKKWIGGVASAVYGKAATDLWACSANAGGYLFGNRDFRTFSNGIDINRFSFNSASRSRIRESLGIDEDTYLIGSIGRISLQKNPLFQLQVFSELRNKIPNSVFCMVGSGDLEDAVTQEAEKLSLGESLLRVARTSEPESFYSAFDALLFPPIFEGLSFVGIEAQCSGLPVFGSKALPRELGITDLIRFDSLEEKPASWAVRIAEQAGRCDTAKRFSYSDRLRDAGFSKAECFKHIALSYKETTNHA